MQVCVTGELKSRILYYLARLFTEQMRRGGDYGDLKRTISL
ncbi:MAG: Rpn family recombination-promoting nuclease/putative transposase, partial [Treponema sp.]|nr:Rpn family recombination-promoting nuclease/putative transposase [Treponema sp.]